MLYLNNNKGVKMLRAKAQTIEDNIIGLTITISETENGETSIHIDRHENFMLDNRDYVFDKTGEIVDRGSWVG
jgi:hypothetical protein